MYTRLKRFIKARRREPTFGGHLTAAMRTTNRELAKRPELPLEKRLRAYRNGFTSESIPLFELDKNDSDNYLSTWTRYAKADRINGEHEVLHEHKFHWYYVLDGPFGNRLPDLYGYLDEGRFRRPPMAVGGFDSIADVLDQQGKAIVKTVGGAGGGGVRLAERLSDGYEIDGERMDREDVDAFERGLADDIVTEYVDQADYASEIFDGSANTIRIMTMVDPVTNEPYIGAAVHRFGLAGGGPIDNWSSRGVSAGIDIDSGRLTTAVGYPENDTRPEFERHPDTGAEITGTPIPEWDDVREEVLEMATYLAPITPYVGWDVLVTSDDGEFSVLESNSEIGVIVTQVSAPLLADERNRRFYEHHGVI